MRALGSHSDQFRIDEWFQTLDRRVRDAAEIVPRDGRWIVEATIAEARRRGLPVAGEQNPYAHFTTAWECRHCGQVHEGTQHEYLQRICRQQTAARVLS